MARSQQMFTQPGQMYAPDTQRRMALAQALRAQGLQTPQGTSMGSGTMQRFAAPHWTQYVANLAQGLSGAYMEHQAEQTNQDRMSEFVQALRGTDSPQYVMDPGYEQPSQMDRLAALEDNPFAQQALMNLSTQSAAPQYRTLSPEEAAQMGLPEGVWQMSPEGQIEPAYEAEGPDQTSAMQEYEFARQQGFPGSFMDYQMQKSQAGAANVNVNAGDSGTRYEVGSIPQGYRLVYDDQGRPVSMEAVPGGPASLEAEEAADKKFNREETTNLAARTVVQDMNRGIEVLEQNIEGMIPTATGPIAMIARHIPWTDANALEKFNESVKSNVSIDRLQAMREASPTGGALGQVPVQQQKFLMQMLGSLELEQRPEILLDNMKRIYNIYADSIQGTLEELQREFGEEEGLRLYQENQKTMPRYSLSFDEAGRRVEGGFPWRGIESIGGPAIDPESNPGGGVPEGIAPEDWKHMTAEEKKLFQ